jgi:hypothetical protein
LLLLAVTAVIGAAAHASEGPLRAQLVSPAPAATLTAGSTATITWDAADIPGNFDEWEAFLSLDSGRTYPLRITPHLDLAIRTFTWTVPNLPGSEGSILLRFGDEREEQRVAYRERFRITGSLSVARPWSASVRAGTHGEAAVPDDEGVVAWVDGPRNGSSITQVAVQDEALSAKPELVASAPGATDLLTGTSPRSDRDAVRSSARCELIPRVSIQRVSQSRQIRPADILLITRRRNV